MNKKIERILNQCSRSPCMEIMNLVLVADECCKDDNVHKNDGLCFYSEDKIIENFPLVVTFASRYFTSFNLIMPLNPSYIFIL